MIATIALAAVGMFTVAFAIVAFLHEREDRRREAQIISRMGDQARIYRARYASVAVEPPEKPRPKLVDEVRQRDIRNGAMRARATGRERRRAA